MDLLRLAAIAILGATPAVGLGACYGATELTIELTTDVPCGEGLTTTVYKGARREEGKVRYDEGAIAETSRCVLGVPDHDIGSIVFVPRGPRDAEAAVKVVLATEGERAEDCARDPAGKACIVATRSFSFVEHAALRLPITLHSSCRGVVCGEGETCVVGGRCVDDRVVCDGDHCAPPGERAGGDGGERDGGPPPVADAGLPPVDAGPLPTCGGESGPELVESSDKPTLFAVGSEQLFYVEGTELKAIGKRGGPVTRVLESNGAPISLDVLGTSWALGTEKVVHRKLAAGAEGETELLAATHVAIFDERELFAAGLVPRTSGGNDVVVVRVDDAVQPLHFAKGPIVTDKSTLYFVSSAGEFQARRLGVDGATPVTLIEAAASPLVARSFDGDAFVYVATPGSGPNGAFRKLAGLATPPEAMHPAHDVAAFAADANVLHWFRKDDERRVIFSQRYGADGDPTKTHVGGPVIALGVDDQCLYYWVDSATLNQPSFKLRSIPKPVSTQSNTAP